MRWKYVKYTALGITGILLLLLIWGVVIEPRLVDFKAETAAIPNLPTAWENKRVALIADMQIGMWLGNEGTVTKIVKRIIEERPAAVFIAGDFVYKPTDENETDEVEREDVKDFMGEVNKSVAMISPLIKAGIPTYAVLGNHDYGMNHPDSVKNEQLANAVRQTLSQVTKNMPRIILMHNPDSFAEFPANAAPLALAGHTHGGQIRIPFTENWSWMALVSEEKVKADGWIDNFGQTGNHLYVNRGIGFSSFPVRINCRPELTIFTLRSRNN